MPEAVGELVVLPARSSARWENSGAREAQFAPRMILNPRTEVQVLRRFPQGAFVPRSSVEVLGRMTPGDCTVLHPDNLQGQ